VGDDVVLPEVQAPTSQAPGSWKPGAEESFICRGCYYIYDETKGAPGAPPGTKFASIVPTWRCPDCGTDKATFHPYLPTL
jgi:GntR family transcriptional regulator/MocR family aminotransferase